MKTAKVFKHGNSQAVRLPKEFRVAETELLIKKSGESIVLTPKKASGWKNVRAAIAMFKGPIERKQPQDFDQRHWRE
ncbi:MAG: AbrB/MazE/SpoVT family DNA-binding domain-containing protein [Betaproteobacteria bacterium]|nr:AbrB/MazE/SpoVT family DNA-binding domain-containing protein [Betaproteobacteria bacterium]